MSSGRKLNSWVPGVSGLYPRINDNKNDPVRNERDVFDRWKTDFEKIYNGDNSDSFANQHYEMFKTHNTLLEHNMCDPSYIHNDQLNYSVTIEEVTRLILKAKSRSACGYDGVPYALRMHLVQQFSANYSR